MSGPKLHLDLQFKNFIQQINALINNATEVGIDILSSLNDILAELVTKTSDELFLDFCLQEPSDQIAIWQIEQIASKIWSKWCMNRHNSCSVEERFIHQVYTLHQRMISIQRFDETWDDPYTGTFNQRAKLLYIRTTLTSFEKLVQSIDSISTDIVKHLNLWLNVIACLRYRRHSSRSQLRDLDNIIMQRLLSDEFRMHIRKKSANCEESIEYFYLYTCPFYIAFSRPKETEWMRLEPLLHFCRQYIIEATEFIDSWSPSQLLYITASQALISMTYRIRLDYHSHYNRLTDYVWPQHQKEYLTSLLSVLLHANLRARLEAHCLNVETQLIDMILKYLRKIVLDRSGRREGLLHFMRSKNLLSICLPFLHAIYNPIKINTCLLLAQAIRDRDDNREIERFLDIFLDVFDSLGIIYTINPDPLNTINLNDRALFAYEQIAHIRSVQEILITLDRSAPHIGVENRPYMKAVPPRIVWALSFNPSMQEELINDEILQEDMTKTARVPSVMNWNVAWSLGKHDWMAKFGPRFKYVTATIIDELCTNKWDVILSYSRIEKNSLVPVIETALMSHGYRVWLADRTIEDVSSISIMALAVHQIGCFIMCLSDQYERDNECKSHYMLANKRQKRMKFVPVRVEKDYEGDQWVLDAIQTRSIVDFTVNDRQQAIQQLRDAIENNFDDFHGLEKSAESNDIPDIQESIEELYFACKNNEIEMVRNYLSRMPIKQINRFAKNGSTALHVAVYMGYEEIVRLLLTHGASRSIRNKISGLRAYDEAANRRIKELFKRTPHDNMHFVGDFFSRPDAGEWILAFDSPIIKRTQFRQRLPQNTSLPSLTTVFENLRKEYLYEISTEDLSTKDKRLIDSFLEGAIDDGDIRYFLRAYTSTTKFYKILNQDLVNYSLAYLHPNVGPMNYTRVNSLIDMISLLINNAQLEPYYYQGVCYRGMLMTSDELAKYKVGSHIINIAFLSTSKQRDVAAKFAAEGQANHLRCQPNGDHILVSVLCTYTVRHLSTSVDVSNLSEVPDEEEVLILPYSAFRVRIKKEYDPEIPDVKLLAELELEECELDADRDNPNKREITITFGGRSAANFTYDENAPIHQKNVT